MEIIERLPTKEAWEAFLARKIEQDTMTRKELADLTAFVTAEEYLPVTSEMAERYVFPLPTLKEINRLSNGKKRVVYTFPRTENYILKLITFLLHEFDSQFSQNLYSFKERTGVKQAVQRISSRVDIRNCYSYKVDIHDYFNSIDVGLLMPMLKKLLINEPKTVDFFNRLLNEPRVISGNQTEERKKGVMAGLPTSGFMANLYLSDMDFWFEERNIPYIRYSDDIIVFAETAEEITEYESRIKDYLKKMNLTVNESKEVRTLPGEPMEFLGFRFEDGNIDVSHISLLKIKSKLRRKARAIYRWKNRKGVSDEKAIKVYIDFLNKKFYNNPVHEEITWCRWYFPVLTTDRSLKLIDEYAVSCIRYLKTGRYGKTNYHLRYETIKEYGYRSLVHSFWEMKRGLKHSKNQTR